MEGHWGARKGRAPEGIEGQWRALKDPRVLEGTAWLFHPFLFRLYQFPFLFKQFQLQISTCSLFHAFFINFPSFFINYHPWFIRFSSVFHPFFIRFSSIFHLFFIHFSSISHPFLIHVSSTSSISNPFLIHHPFLIHFYRRPLHSAVIGRPLIFPLGSHHCLRSWVLDAITHVQCKVTGNRFEKDEWANVKTSMTFKSICLWVYSVKVWDYVESSNEHTRAQKIEHGWHAHMRV